jgi:hypothetical protein
MSWENADYADSADGAGKNPFGCSVREISIIREIRESES